MCSLSADRAVLARHDRHRQQIAVVGFVALGDLIYGVSFRAKTIYFDFNGRLNEECNQAFKHRHMHNPFSAYMQHQPVGRLVTSDEIVALDILRKTAFYDEVLRPQDVAYSGMMALAASNGYTAAFNLCRSARQGALARRSRNSLRG